MEKNALSRRDETISKISRGANGWIRGNFAKPPQCLKNNVSRSEEIIEAKAR